ncbi:hypothetical protein [Streptomyces bluensis]|uniref:hypothetical protein n=1 Tax=Streptomyces bluensis TaxID=33897 RepID=UPI00333150A3
MSTAGSTRAPELPSTTFLALVEEFFDKQGKPVSFYMRKKRNTQDDPFDEHVIKVLGERLGEDKGLLVVPSTGKLISPDAVVARPEEYDLLLKGGADFDTRAICGIEVKKLELEKRTGSKGKKSSRRAGMDYNSTPPCATVRVYSASGTPLRIPCYYVFSLLVETDKEDHWETQALVMVAGSVLNSDEDLYDEITGIRSKAIGLGSYGDGANRERPMLVFANPLGWDWVIGSATIISDRDDLESEHPLTRVRDITRTTVNGVESRFYCYRLSDLNPPVEDTVDDPFPTPKRRSTQTSQRGKFVVKLGEIKTSQMPLG